MSLTLTLSRDGGEVSGAGTDIVLNDTATGYHIQDLKMYGDTSQQTYSGAQLLTAQGMATPTSDTTFWNTLSTTLTMTPKDNGWCNITQSSSGWGNFQASRAAIYNFTESTTYTLIFEVANVSGASNGYIQFTQPAQTQDAFASFSIVTGASGGDSGNARTTLTNPDAISVLVVTTKESFASSTRGLRMYTGSNTTVGAKFDIRVTVLSGDHSTDWQNYAGENWQPFVGNIASPNPDYPQEVKTVSGSQTFNFTGKNLINSFAFDDYAHSGSASVQIETDGTIVLSGNTSSNGYFRLYQPLRVLAPSLQAGHTYYIYVENNFQDRTYIYLTGSDSNWYTGTAHTMTQDEINLDIAIYGGYNQTSNIRIMITESLDNIYAPYENDMSLLNLANGKNAFDGEIEAGNYSTSTGEGSDSTTQCRSTNFTQVKPNTTYTGSLNGTKIANNGWRMLFYGKDKGYLNSSVTTGTFTTPADCYFVKWHSTSIRTNYPNFDAPLQIEEGSSATAFEKYSSLELCKIGTYQDYIYKNNGNWYIHKDTGKVVLNGTEAGWYSDTTGGFIRCVVPVSDMIYNTSRVATGILSDYFTPDIVNGYGVFFRNQSTAVFYPQSTITSLDDFKTWLSTNNTSVYYWLATPTDTQITDAALFAQLEAIEDTPTFDETTIISVTSQNLASSLEVTAEVPIRKTYTEVDISSPFTISDVEGKSQSTTLDGNVYVDWAYNKKQYSFDIFNLAPQDYADIRAYYDYQFTSSAFPTITIPELGIDKLPVYMTMSSRNIVNQCLLADKLTLKFRETIQP